MVLRDLVLVFVITMMFAPSAAASDARSEAAGDAGTSSRPSDKADEAAPPAPEGWRAFRVGLCTRIAKLKMLHIGSSLEPASRRYRNYEYEYLATAHCVLAPRMS